MTLPHNKRRKLIAIIFALTFINYLRSTSNLTRQITENIDKQQNNEQITHLSPSLSSSNNMPPFQQHRCAINLYGLPRSLKHHFLPSFITNVVQVNRHYHCDYFVHYYNKTFEPEGRSGQGGNIYPEDVLLLKSAIEELRNNSSSPHRHGQPPIIVQFVGDTDEDFKNERRDHLQTIFEYKDGVDTNPYFITNPKIAKSMKGKEVLFNILKMWHSQTKVWQLMEKYEARAVNDSHQHQQEHQQPFYSRVAMFRLDVVYITPIDIYKVPNEPDAALQGSKSSWSPTTNVTNHYFNDVQNRHAVIPAFASYPVNDRMIYGLYAAVKIWATERWERYQHHVFTVLPAKGKSEAGSGLHDERMIKYSIIPAIQNECGVEVVQDSGVYFLRVRANGEILLEDSCKGTKDERKTVKALLELSLQRNCGEPLHNHIKCPPV